MAVIETPAVEAPPTPQAPEAPARKQAVSDYTRDLLLKVRDKILDEPTSCYMATWACSTTACIAGHAALIAGMDRQLIHNWAWSLTGNQEAAAIIGISHREAIRLFHVRNWPEPYHAAMLKVGDGTPAGTEVAAARIMHFIETGK